MKRRLMISIAGAMSALGLVIAPPLLAAEIVLKAGHSQNASEPMDLGLKMMSEHLEKATGGQATIEVFPNMQLGGEVEMIKQVLTGSLDITSPSNAPLTNFVPELKLFDMPFLFRDEAHMIKVLRGPMLGEINNIVAKRGIRLLGVYNRGNRDMIASYVVRNLSRALSDAIPPEETGFRFLRRHFVAFARGFDNRYEGRHRSKGTRHRCPRPRALLESRRADRR